MVSREPSAARARRVASCKVSNENSASRETPLEVLQGVLRANAGPYGAHRGQILALERLTRTTPALRAANLLQRDTLAQELAEALTRRDPNLSPKSARLVAAVAMAATAAAAWHEGPGEYVDHLDAAFADVAWLCRSIARPPPIP